MQKPDGSSAPYTTIAVSGADAADFLQGQLTSDVLALVEGEAPVLSAWCNPKGRVIALFRLRLADGVLRLALPGARRRRPGVVGTGR